MTFIPGRSKAELRLSSSSLKEGDTLTTTVDTKNVKPGTTLFWTLSGRGIDSKDLAKGSLTGSGIVSRTGSFSFSHLFSEDLTTEGDEKLIISLFSDKSLKNPVAETAVAIVDSSTKTVQAPVYALTTSADSIKEGGSLTTTVDTKNVKAGTTLFWTLSGNGITSTDFDKGDLKGSGIVATDGSFSFSHLFSEDLTTEGDEKLIISLFSDKSLKNPVAETAVAIVDSSTKTVQPPVYALTTSADSIKEGGSLTTTVDTKNVKAGTTLFWTLSGNGITSTDFDKGDLKGSGIVATDGSFSFSHLFSEDLTTEGDEKLIISLFSDKSLKNPVAETAVAIVDSSTKTVQPPVYALTTSADSIKEGGSLTTTVDTKNVKAGTTLFWTLSGNGITSTDFDKGDLKGSGIVATDGSFSFSHALSADALKEGTEQITIGLFTDSSLSKAVAKAAVAITDGSSTTLPAYELAPSSSSLKEGDTLTTTVDTKNVKAGTTLFWTLSGNGITSTDFDKGDLKGSGIVATDGSFSFSHLFSEDLTTEGDEKLIISLFSDKSLKNPVAETAVAIVDSSTKTVQPPVYALTSSAATIKEGGSLTTTVDTKNVKAGTTLFWSLSGNGITSTDFDKGDLKGSGIVATDGSFSFSHTISNDNNQEEVEPFTIGLFTDSTLTNVVAKTSVSIADGTSGGITIKSRNIIREGQVLTSKGKAPSLKGETIYLASQGTNITEKDFTKDSHIVKTKVAANGTFKIKQFIARDLVTEGSETFVLEAFKDSKLTQPAGGTSNPISIADTSRQTSYPGDWFTIGKNSVFHRGFNVLTPGPVTIIVDGQVGQSVEASLYGSSNYSKGQIKPVAKQIDATGNTEFTFDVTAQHLKKGNNYRLGIAGGTQDNEGTYEIRIPEKTALVNTFLKERVELATGAVWRSKKDQNKHYNNLINSNDGLSSILGTRISCIDTHRFKLYETQDLCSTSSSQKTGLVNPRDAKIITKQELRDYIFPLPGELKIDQNILTKNFALFKDDTGQNNNINGVINNNGTLALTIQVSSPNQRESTKTKIQGIGYQPKPLTPDTLTINNVKYKDLLKIADIQSVVFIDQGRSNAFSENALERGLVNANNVQTEDINDNGMLDIGNNEDFNGNGLPDFNNGVSGRGVTVAVKDNDVRPHPDLTFSPNGNTGSTNTLGATGTPDHGTHVAGIIASNGANSVGTRSERGLAYNSLIFDVLNRTWREADLINMEADSVDVINQSQGLDRNGVYTNNGSRLLDQLAAGRAGTKSMAITLSAGNGGTSAQSGSQWGFFAPTKQVKNAFVVANLEGGNADLLATGSSRGPFHDGRIAPTISAPGGGAFDVSLDVTSTGFHDCNPNVGDNCTGAYRYEGMSGTSMASPMVAGTMALMMEAYESDYLEQYGQTIDTFTPIPALMRAIIIATSDDIVGQQGTSAELFNAPGAAGVANQAQAATIGPDYLTGFGRLNVGESVDLIQQSREDSNGNNQPTGFKTGSIGDKEVHEFSFAVSPDMSINQTDPLQIALVWDDVEANPITAGGGATNPLLQNDLDIELISPINNITYYPWRLGHTIVDAAGNTIDDENQTPGTISANNINIPISPVTNPRDSFVPPATLPDGPGNDIAGTHYERINVNPFADTDVGVDNDNDGVWVAQRGKDHLNNHELVTLDPTLTPNILEEGNWTVRITGFNVQNGPQTYAVAGMPDPDLPDLKVEPITRIALDSDGGNHNFTWKALNLGDIDADASDYKIYLSTDISVDGNDVPLTDINPTNAGQTLEALAAGDETPDIISTVNITDNKAAQLLGAGSTVSDLIDQDVFLLVQADPDDNIIEYAEENTAAMQIAEQVDVVLVLDRSGSMNDNVTASNGRKKVDLMRESADLFLDMLRVDANDRFAGVRFNQSASIIFPSNNNSLVEITDDEVEDASDIINSNQLNPSGMTDIHAALDEAHELLTAGDNTSPKTIVFLSDGVSTTGDHQPTDILPELANDGIKVYSVGFGNNGSSDIDIDLLSQLADQTDGGFWQYAQNGLSLDKFFVNAVANAIGDDVIIDPVGELNKGQSTSVDVPLSSASGTVRFILTTDEDKPSKTLDFNIQTPSGLSINADNFDNFEGINFTTGGPGYQVYEVELPLKGIAEEDQSGDWEMVINNPASTNKTIGYTASVIGQTQLHLSLDAAAQPSVVQSNQPLIAGLKLHSNGEDISFMEASVTIKGFKKTLEQVVQQATGFSSIKDYVDNEGAHLRTTENANNGELRTDANIADHLLSKDHSKLYKTLRTFQDLQTIDLTSDDQRIKGVTKFNQRLTNLDLNPGPIELVYTVNGRLDDCTPFTRELTHSVFLKPKNYRRPEILQPGDDNGTPDIPEVSIPGFSGDTITSQPGVATLDGTNGTEAFTFDGNSDLGVDGADTITNFNPREDILAFESEGFPDLGNAKGKISIKITQKTNKKFDRLMKSKNDFVFVQKTGGLYYNDNGKKNGNGEDGGLIAILDGTKSINANNIELF